MAQQNQQQPAGAQARHAQQRRGRGSRGGEAARLKIAIANLQRGLPPAQQVAGGDGQRQEVLLKALKIICDTLRGVAKDIIHSTRPSAGPQAAQQRPQQQQHHHQQQQHQPQREQQQPAAAEVDAPPLLPGQAPDPAQALSTGTTTTGQQGPRFTRQATQNAAMRHQLLQLQQVQQAAQPQPLQPPPDRAPERQLPKRKLNDGLARHNQAKQAKAAAKAEALAQAASAAAAAAAAGLGGASRAASEQGEQRTQEEQQEQQEQQQQQQEEQQAKEDQQPPGAGAAPSGSRNKAAGEGQRQHVQAAATAAAVANAGTTINPDPGPSTGAGDGREQAAPRAAQAQHNYPLRSASHGHQAHGGKEHSTAQSTQRRGRTSDRGR